MKIQKSSAMTSMLLIVNQIQTTQN